VAARRLTPDQRAALEIEGASVALSAGAGSGKTLVLAERFLRALETDQPLPLGGIVALTFTEKAARELRERVRRECRARARGDSRVEMTNSGSASGRGRFWRHVERGLEAASITTFHSFCADLLRRYPIESGVEPGFSLLDNTVAPVIRSEAVDACLLRWLAEGRSELVELAVPAGLAKVREVVSRLVEHHSHRELASWSKRSVDEVYREWLTVWREEVVRSAANQFEAAVARNLPTILAHPCRAPKLSRKIAWLQTAVHELERRALDCKFLARIQQATSLQGARSSHWPSPEIYERVKASILDLRRSASEAAAIHDWDEASTRAAIQQGLHLASLAAEANIGFATLKRSRGLLDFADLQQSVRTLLLEGDPRAVAEICSSVSLILVDEFQDTDPIQTEILSHLAGEDAHVGKLFLVGDRKQSIYAFRGARPDLFDELRDRFPTHGRRSLADNFRSRPEILHFVNALFLGTMAAEDDALRPTREQPSAGSGDHPVELHWAVRTDPGDNRPSRREQRRREEGRWLARYVKHRLDQGWSVVDRETGQPRPADAGDIVFLFRSLNDSASYERALVEAGLDYYVVKGTAFFVQQEVVDLVNVLSAIEDPLDALALVGVLRSPFFGVSDEGLYWLSRAPGGVREGLGRADRISDLCVRDRSRVKRASALLASWRNIKDRFPVARLLNVVLDQSGYEAAILAEPLGERKRANCRKLVRLARLYDALGGISLAQFVSRLKDDLDSPPREDQAATTDEQGPVIRLMTIHQAKGLEFPIVVLPDLNRGDQNDREPAVFHTDLGMIVRSAFDIDAADDDEQSNHAAAGEVSASLGACCWKVLATRERKEEALRLLYVAATRARDYLILSADLASAPNANTGRLSPAVSLLTTRFDCDTGSCLSQLPANWPVPRIHIVHASEMPDEPPPASRRRRRFGGKAIGLTVRAIENALARTAAEEGPRPSPSIQAAGGLDLDRGVSVAPSVREIELLVRGLASYTSSPGADEKRVEEIADHVARTMLPRPSSAQRSRAIRRARFLLTHERLVQTARLEHLERGIRWSLACQRSRMPLFHDTERAGSANLVLRGSLELAGHDARGVWSIVTVHLAEREVNSSRARLRLISGARALKATGPIEGTILWVEPNGEIQLEAVSNVSERALHEALDVSAID
jgi:ATP-dependent helicase/nuclease subunit A